MTPAEAIEQVALLAESFGVLDLGSAVVLEAGRGVRDHGLSFYDAQIWAIAKLNQIPVVFTEDFQDGMSLEGVRFVNPFAQGFDLGRWI
jgi:predicted nucleic acid-binding protein